LVKSGLWWILACKVFIPKGIVCKVFKGKG
jgi:hypothetical protein